MTTETTIQELAQDAYKCFEIARRATGDTATGPREDGDEFVRTIDGTPEWVRQLVQDAHGEFLPDDWRYSTIREALEFIADADDPDDGSGEFADDAVDVYTGGRLQWLSSNLRRVGYCDEATQEYGHGKGDIVTMIGWGQYMEAEEVYASVLRSLEARLQELEGERVA